MILDNSKAKLAAYASKKYVSTYLGSGKHGTVSKSTLKDGTPVAVKHTQNISFPQNATLMEADVQSAAADLGIAPEVHSVKIHPGSSLFNPSKNPDEIVMDILSEPDYITFNEYVKTAQPILESQNPKGDYEKMIENLLTAKTQAQIASLAYDKGYILKDRHRDNVFIRPNANNALSPDLVQIDFGESQKLFSDDARARVAAETISEGLESISSKQISNIFHGLLKEQIEAGNLDEVNSLIRQGIGILDDYVPNHTYSYL